jgi:hypothetical protein
MLYLSAFSSFSNFSIVDLNAPPGPETVMHHWKGGSSSSWYDLNNWKMDSAGTIPATALPTAQSQVQVNADGLVIELDYTASGVYWIDPASIVATGHLVTIHSSIGKAFNTSFTGTFSLTGSARFGHAEAIYWKGGHSTSWYDIQNWFTTSAGTTQASRIPLSTANVFIAAAGLSIDLDYNQSGVSWIQPASISSGVYNVTVTSSANPKPVFDNANISSTTGQWTFNNVTLGQP